MATRLPKTHGDFFLGNPTEEFKGKRQNDWHLPES